MKFTRAQLDKFTDICGLLIAVSTVLTANNYIPMREGVTFSGIVGAIACYLTNKPAQPSNED
jgi:hypothetical protein